MRRKCPNKKKNLKKGIDAIRQELNLRETAQQSQGNMKDLSPEKPLEKRQSHIKNLRSVKKTSVVDICKQFSDIGLDDKKSGKTTDNLLVQATDLNFEGAHALPVSRKTSYSLLFLKRTYTTTGIY